MKNVKPDIRWLNDLISFRYHEKYNVPHVFFLPSEDNDKLIQVYVTCVDRETSQGYYITHDYTKPKKQYGETGDEPLYDNFELKFVEKQEYDGVHGTYDEMEPFMIFELK